MRPWPPTGATRPLKKKCGACWQRPRQWMLKRMPIMVPTGEGMSYRKGARGTDGAAQAPEGSQGTSAAGG